MGVTSEKRSREFNVAEQFEKSSFSGGLLLNLRCDLHHWSNNVLIAQLGEFTFALRVVE